MKRLVLVGGGHAHVHVLDRLAESGGWSGAEVVMVAPPRHHYSGMLPGYLQGQYGEADLRFDLPALCRAAGVRFVDGLAIRIEVDSGQGGRVHLSDRTIPFHHCSMDVGSAPRTWGVPGVKDHALSLRPTSRVLELDRRLAGLALRGAVPKPGSAASEQGAAASISGPVVSEPRVAASKPGPMGSAPGAAVVVVGAGAAGFEVAVAVAVRSGAEVTLVEESPQLLPGYSARVRRKAHAVLDRWGVRFLPGTAALEVNDGQVRVGEGRSAGSDEGPATRSEEEAAVSTRDGARPSDVGLGAQSTNRGRGRSLPSDLTIWLAGAGPPPLLAQSDLPLTDEGFFAVDQSLRAVDGVPVWGAGDCIGLRGYPWMPRAGVYAVRQAPVLARNLEMALTEEGVGSFHSYEPQASFLSLLNTGKGRALLRWKRLVYEGRGAWWLKDWIDSRFMRRYHELESATLEEEDSQ